MNVTKICPGEYEVASGERRVRVTRVVYPRDGVYWIAAAGWDRYLLTDPLDTKRDAVLNAREMLAEADALDEERARKIVLDPT